MTLSATFDRRYREATLLEAGGELDAALIAYTQLFDPFEAPKERRIAPASFCLQVEMRKAALLVRLGRADEAQELLEVEWIWRLISAADDQARAHFFQQYGSTRATAGQPPGAHDLLQRLERAALAQSHLRGWEGFLRHFPI